MRAQRFRRYYPDCFLEAIVRALTKVPGGTRLATLLLSPAVNRLMRRDLIGTSDDLRFLFYCKLSSWLEKQLFLYGHFEEAIRDFLVETLQPGDTFVDVGANIGCFTLRASEVIGATGKVLAFEPDPDAFPRLRANVQLNNFDNVILQNLALGANSGEMKLYRGGGDWTHCSSIYPSSWHNPDSYAIVKVSTLDDALEGLSVRAVRLLKIDVEGAELDVLMGSQNVLRELRPAVLLEVSRHTQEASGAAPSDVVRFLEEHGYHCYCLKETGEISLLDKNVAFWPSMFTLVAKPVLSARN